MKVLDSDGALYFSALATTINAWRSAQNARKIRDKWMELFPATVGPLKRLPPKPLRGRWGSASQTEA
eukprot:11782183-Alexandrium_andersonii.AAC.1